MSVIIISKNNRRKLETAVESVAKVNYPPSKIQCIVLEETDTPGTFDAWVDYHSIEVRNLGFGFARNRALSFAKNGIILFTDDDCVVEKNWIRELVYPLMESQKIAAVGGAVYVPQCGVIGKCENIIGFPGGGIRYVHLAGGKTIRRDTFSTCNCAVRRSAIDEAGGFDESMRMGGEDEELSRLISAEWLIVYNPAAIVYHQPRDSFVSVYKWFVRRGMVEACRVSKAEKRGSIIAILLRNSIIVRIAAVCLLSVFSRMGFLFFLFSAVVFYGFLLYKFRWSLRYYKSPKIFLMIPLVRGIMDIGRDCGIVKGMVFGFNKSRLPPRSYVK